MYLVDTLNLDNLIWKLALVTVLNQLFRHRLSTLPKSVWRQIPKNSHQLTVCWQNCPILMLPDPSYDLPSNCTKTYTNSHHINTKGKLQWGPHVLHRPCAVWVHMSMPLLLTGDNSQVWNLNSNSPSVHSWSLSWAGEDQKQGREDQRNHIVSLQVISMQAIYIAIWWQKRLPLERIM